MNMKEKVDCTSEVTKVISGANVADYIDQTTDGGYWYKINGKKAEFVKVTDKALEIFGYESFNEMLEQGVNPHSIIHPIIREDSSKREEEYWDFIKGNSDRFYMDCSISCVSGEELYAELFIAHTLVFKDEMPDDVFRVMIHLLTPTEAIFRQSKQLLDQMSSGMVILQEEREERFALRYGNDGLCETLEWSKDELIGYYGRDAKHFIYDEDYEVVLPTFREALRTGRNLRNTYRIIGKNGAPVWIKAEHKRIIVGKQRLIYINFININDLMFIQEEMKKTNDRLSSFLNHTPAGIIVFEKTADEYSIAAINTTLINKLNRLEKRVPMRNIIISKEDFVGKPANQVLQFIDPLDLPLVNEMISRIELEQSLQCNFKLNLEEVSEKEQVWIHCNALSRKVSANTSQIVAVYEDISKQVLAELEIKANQSKIINMSYHDALTGVLNRTSYNKFMKVRGDSKFDNTGIAFVDINGLKVINDSYGHTKGDDALKLTVMLMERYFDKDEIYRIGGDMFVAIKEGVEQEVFYSQIGDLIADFKKYEIASVGYIWDDKITNILHSIDKAESLMRIVKQNYYANHMEDISRHRPEDLNELIVDIERGRYVMYLQPKAQTNGTKIIAAESLIRRRESDGTVTGPSAFVSKYEHEHLISHLDLFMLEETCKTLEKWAEEGKEEIKISVNMSRVTLAEPDYINRILNITDKYNIKKSQIEFEITESTETMDRHLLENIVEKVADLGFGVSLDDLGTEYSSVMMLTMKGIDTVKIDRGFILQMGTDKGRTLVDHIIKMCHDLGEMCIAEGVEDHETRRLLEEMGCDMYQGYLLAKPVSVNEFEKLIAV